VDELVVSKYLGLWYQMYADQIVYSTFEKDAYCATALYADNGNGTISVHNYAAIGSPSGAPYIIDGYAYQDNLVGLLKYHFFAYFLTIFLRYVLISPTSLDSSR